MYKVETYDIRAGIMGAKTAKMDKRLTELLNQRESEGWEFVSMTELSSDSKSFTFQLVFKKKN